VQEEPTDHFLLEILRAFYFDRGPRIVTAVCENIFGPVSWRLNLKRRILWRRLDGLLAVAQASVEGIRRAGMPRSVPAQSLVAGAMSPPQAMEPFPLPFARRQGDFLVAFAGRICEEKGWKVLLEAVRSLPELVRCLMAADGPQAGELREWIGRADLRDRVFCTGLLPRPRLLALLSAADCLVLPSITTPRWKEQFGGVLADGMAVGLPLVGSDSGAIPEVIGPAGLVFPEGDEAALRQTIERLRNDPALRQRLGAEGRRRFDEEFAIPAYARKIAHMLRIELL
jgi:glycosyltransferase involved in cell wall biosynthesis